MEPERQATPSVARRVFVIGQSGIGKSTLARRIGRELSVPVHDLDLVFREGGGNGPPRPDNVVAHELATICAQPTWVVEGVQIDGTQQLMDAADVIVWLDHGSWLTASMRITRRFVAGAWSEFRRQRGLRRFFRFGDYWRHLRELGRALPEARGYGSSATDGDGAQMAAPTRREVAERLSSYGTKVWQCSTEADVEAALARLVTASATPH